MEIGTGIFLGSVVLAFVGLYAVTKDRWRWKRIVGWALSALVLAAVGLGGWILYADRNAGHVGGPVVLSSFWDLTIGMPESEVKFRKGEPSSDSKRSPWIYKISDDLFYVIGFSDGRVGFVIADSGSWAYLPEVSGFPLSATQEDLEKQYGKASHVAASKDGLSRRLSFAKHNLVVGMQKNKITSYGMYDGTGRPLGFQSDEAEAADKK